MNFFIGMVDAPQKLESRNPVHNSSCVQKSKAPSQAKAWMVAMGFPALPETGDATGVSAVPVRTSSVQAWQ
jgi:hypothetical protein